MCARFNLAEIWVNTSITVGVNLINNGGVISDFTRKAKLNFCDAYRVNCLRNKLKISM